MKISENLSYFGNDKLVIEGATCPKCKEYLTINEWVDVDIFCDVCGEHPGVSCSKCHEYYDHVWADELKRNLKYST